MHTIHCTVVYSDLEKTQLNIELDEADVDRYNLIVRMMDSARFDLPPQVTYECPQPINFDNEFNKSNYDILVNGVMIAIFSLSFDQYKAFERVSKAVEDLYTKTYDIFPKKFTIRENLGIQAGDLMVNANILKSRSEWKDPTPAIPDIPEGHSEFEVGLRPSDTRKMFVHLDTEKALRYIDVRNGLKSSGTRKKDLPPFLSQPKFPYKGLSEFISNRSPEPLEIWDFYKEDEKIDSLLAESKSIDAFLEIQDLVIRGIGSITNEDWLYLGVRKVVAEVKGEDITEQVMVTEPMTNSVFVDFTVSMNIDGHEATFSISASGPQEIKDRIRDVATSLSYMAMDRVEYHETKEKEKLDVYPTEGADLNVED